MSDTKAKSKMPPMDTKKKVMIAVCIAGFILCLSMFCGVFVMITRDGIAALSEFGIVTFLKCVVYGFTNQASLLIIAITSILAIGGMYMLSHSTHDLDRVDYRDERGVEYDTKQVYGSAQPMLKEEGQKIFEWGSIENVKGPILGQWTTGGKETICLSPATDRNRNILVLGSPGTGKSFCYVRGAVFQAVRRGESILVTDPKGEIYRDMANFLREQGYEVRVFDLVNLQASDSWDCMQEIYDPITNDLDQLRMNEFSETIFSNTCQGKDDPFWGTGERNLFNAVLAFSAFCHERDVRRVYLRAAKMLLHDDQNGDITPLETQSKFLDKLDLAGHTTMADRTKIVCYLLETYRPDENIEDNLNSIEKGEWTKEHVAQCDIATVYQIIIGKTIDEIEDLFVNAHIPFSHVAAIAWNIFKNGSDNTKPGFVTGLGQRLYLFQMRDLRRITSKQECDTIKFERLGERKCAYFCVISDKNAVMRPISSLFFNFLFRDVADAADRFGPENRLSVNVICDEFVNLGAIPGFEVTIATVRSRKINISVILQSTSQLTQVYIDPNKANTIIGCCDTILFLGCNDRETAEFISWLSGIASIRVLSTKDERPNSIGWRPVGQGYSLSDGAGKRNLYNPDEILRLPRDKVLIYHNGCNMLCANRCGFIEHPYFKAGMPPQENLADRVPARERFALNEHLDAFTVADMNRATREAAINDKEREKKSQHKYENNGKNCGGSRYKGSNNLTDD